MNTRNLAVITARSGSKGLPDKNIKMLGGRELMAYSIIAARESNLFDTVYVSTDSKVYAEVARRWGADVPFMRSDAIAGDHASSWDAVKEAVVNYEKAGRIFDTVTLLQPTSPLRTAEDIVNAYALMREKDADYVQSVCEMEHSPLWSNTLPDSLCMEGFMSKEADVPRQELPSYYRLNGAIYIVKRECLDQELDLYGEKSYAYVMPQERSIDIDTLLDFQIAEILLKSEE